MMSDRTDFSDRGSALSAGSTSSGLLAQVKARDPVAWTQLVELYGPLIYGWCRRSGIEAQDARDVVQEVLGSVATSIDDFRGGGPRGQFRAWLRTITRHRVADHFRRHAGSPRAVGGSTALQQLQNVPESADDSAATIRPPKSMRSGKACWNWFERNSRIASGRHSGRRPSTSGGAPTWRNRWACRWMRCIKPNRAFCGGFARCSVTPRRPTRNVLSRRHLGNPEKIVSGLRLTGVN